MAIQISIIEYTIITNQIMGCISPQTERQKRFNYKFTPTFAADMDQLYHYYKKMVKQLKAKNLFAAPSDELRQIITTYLSDPVGFDQDNIGLCAVDAVHKLHPLDYLKNHVTCEWLMEACLRQHKFIQEFPIYLLKFDRCYDQYLEFLYIVSKATSIIVPNKLADFMWHSHMLDHEKYQKDMNKIFGKVLNHTDDFSEEQLKTHAKYTEEVRDQELNIKRKSTMKTTMNNVPNNQSNCGGGWGGGGGGCGGIVGGGGCGGGGCGGGGCGGGGCGGGGCGGGGCGGGGCGG